MNIVFFFAVFDNKQIWWLQSYKICGTEGKSNNSGQWVYLLNPLAKVSQCPIPCCQLCTEGVHHGAIPTTPFYPLYN